ncbi:MAG: arylesterase [Bdellovibrionia bacterium]
MKTIIFLGDSLTAGYGLPIEYSYPAQFAKKVRELGVTIRVLNAGVNGDTTLGGLKRTARLLKHLPHYLVIALGANDMMRNHPIYEVKSNLKQIITEAKNQNVKPILFGMKALPIYGIQYMREFNQIFLDLAQTFVIPYLPFFLEEVAGVAAFNLPDRIHPNLLGQKKIAETVTPFLISVFEKHK